MQKKDTKEKIKAAPQGLLRKPFPLKGRNSLRSDSLPFFTRKRLSPLNAPAMRPKTPKPDSGPKGLSPRPLPHREGRSRERKSGAVNEEDALFPSFLSSSYFPPLSPPYGGGVGGEALKEKVHIPYEVGIHNLIPKKITLFSSFSCTIV